MGNDRSFLGERANSKCAVMTWVLLDDRFTEHPSMQSLREWRVKKLMIQRQLGRAAGVNPRTVMNVELGRQIPRLLSIQRICNALGVEPEDVTEFATALEVSMQVSRSARMDELAARRRSARAEG